MLEPLSSTLILFFFTVLLHQEVCFNYKYAIILWRKLKRGTLLIFYCVIVFLEYWKIKVKCFDKISRLLVNFLPIFVVTSSWIYRSCDCFREKYCLDFLKPKPSLTWWPRDNDDGLIYGNRESSCLFKMEKLGICLTTFVELCLKFSESQF